MHKPAWDDYFISIAHAIKVRSSCSRRQVGALIVNGKQIISTGYNGTPHKIRNCNEGGCERCSAPPEVYPPGTNYDKCTCSHAEENAIVHAARHGMMTKGCDIYTTHSPCIQCAKMIINAGIQKVVHGIDYPDDLGKKLLKEAKIEVIKVNEQCQV
ncbi:MAG TPA: cytidine/deoxycytidylate deaminase family protein [archaeon]|nr:cytidine/deoxycytidylate deaminase family protein [archaeon]